MKIRKHKYRILSFDRGKFYLTEIRAKDDDEAMDMLSEVQTNCSSDILLDRAKYKDLLRTLEIGFKESKKQRRKLK